MRWLFTGPTGRVRQKGLSYEECNAPLAIGAVWGGGADFDGIFGIAPSEKKNEFSRVYKPIIHYIGTKIRA